MRVLVVLLVITAISIANSDIEEIKEHNTFKKELLYKYENYYNHTEALLDTLEHHFNWIDSLDPQDYYESKLQLDSLYNSQL